jgi:hypothetical protein
VVHLVAHRLVDLSGELATVGSRDTAFPPSHGRGDQVTHAGRGWMASSRPVFINNINRRLTNLLGWLREAVPDIVCLQELKAADSEFPAEALRRAGYHAVYRGEELERRGDSSAMGSGCDSDAKAPMPSLADQEPAWGSAAIFARDWGLNQLADRLGEIA